MTRKRRGKMGHAGPPVPVLVHYGGAVDVIAAFRETFPEAEVVDMTTPAGRLRFAELRSTASGGTLETLPIIFKGAP